MKTKLKKTWHKWHKSNISKKSGTPTQSVLGHPKAYSVFIHPSNMPISTLNKKQVCAFTSKKNSTASLKNSTDEGPDKGTNFVFACKNAFA